MFIATISILVQGRCYVWKKFSNERSRRYKLKIGVFSFLLGWRVRTILSVWSYAFLLLIGVCVFLELLLNWIPKPLNNFSQMPLFTLLKFFFSEAIEKKCPCLKSNWSGLLKFRNAHSCLWIDSLQKKINVESIRKYMHNIVSSILDFCVYNRDSINRSIPYNLLNFVIICFFWFST